MSGNLEKIVSLIRKTGDKAIVLDASGEPNYVIMTISDYERLMLGKTEVVGLTEPELLDKINRDINIWKESQNSGEISVDQYDFSREIAADEGFNPDFYNQEILSDFSEEKADSEDEDRYYFEPVEV